MADSYTELNAGTGGSKIDEESLVVNATTVKRARVEIAGAAATEIARVTNSAPGASDMALAVRPVGTTPVSLATMPALVAGTANIGDVDVASLPAGSIAATTAKTADLDTGGGTDTVAMQAIALPASGGAVVGGTSSNPIRVDPTGTTRQPVDLAGSTVPLPTGAATQATLNSCYSVLNNIQAAIEDPGLPSGAATQVTLAAVLAALQAAIPAGNNNIGDVDVASLPALPAGTNNIGDVDVLTLPALPAGNNNIGDVDVASVPKAGTATLSNVSSSATSVTLVAANSNRVGLILVNDSTQVLYLKYGATASSTSYTYKLTAGQIFEMPQPIYTGIIDGIWASANGASRATELT